MRDKLVKLLRVDEGEKLELYKCPAGKWTIGVGHNIEDNGISAAASEFILQEDINIAERECRAKVRCYDDLGPVRQAVVISMLFNLGWPRLSGFKLFLAAIESGDYRCAAAEMLNSKWARQVGVRAIRLAGMMRTNEWPGCV